MLDGLSLNIKYYSPEMSNIQRRGCGVEYYFTEGE